MPEEAGLDIDYDAELAKIQGAVSGTEPLPDPRELAERAAAVISGTVVDDRRTVTFMDEKFRIADKIGAMPLLKFSMYADLSVQDPKALAAMYAMLRDCIYPGTPGCGECEACTPARCGECTACNIAAGMEDVPEDDRPECKVNVPDETACKDYDPGDWGKFESHAMITRAGAEDLMDVITDTMELMAGRPTKPSSGSSPGPRRISAGSTARSSRRQGRGSRR